MRHEWYIIESLDEDKLPTFEIWERITWQQERRDDTRVEVQKGGSPIAAVYKRENAQEIINAHNRGLSA